MNETLCAICDLFNRMCRYYYDSQLSKYLKYSLVDEYVTKIYETIEINLKFSRKRKLDYHNKTSTHYFDEYVC